MATSEDFRFVLVQQPETTAAEELIETMASLGAAFALVMTGEDTPTGIITLEEAEVEKSGTVADIHAVQELTEAVVTFDLEGGDAQELTAYFGDQLAVIVEGARPALIPAADRDLQTAEDVRQLLQSRNLNIIAADSRIPGQPGPVPDPDVTYQCEYGHNVTQRASDPNRECPLDQTQLRR